MKLYIADHTCSQAVQIIVNELGLSPELIHYNEFDKTTSNSDDFATVNPLGYVPVRVLDGERRESLSETIIVASYIWPTSIPKPASLRPPAPWTV